MAEGEGEGKGGGGEGGGGEEEGEVVQLVRKHHPKLSATKTVLLQN